MKHNLLLKTAHIILICMCMYLLPCCNAEDQGAAPVVPAAKPWIPSAWHRVTKNIQMNSLTVEVLPGTEAARDSVKTQIGNDAFIAAPNRISGGILIVYYFSLPPGYVFLLPAEVNALVFTK